MTPLPQYDVVINGAGAAGMIAMLRLSSASFRVLGIEKFSQEEANVGDLRSTAFLMPSIEVLKNAGVWEQLSPSATALNAMQIVDAAQKPPSEIIFHAEEIHKPQFGFNILNSTLKNHLAQAISESDNINILHGEEISEFRQFSDHVELRLQSGAAVQTRLLIGADGRHSAIRKMLKISTKWETTHQSALVFCACHDKPHNNISTEIHKSGGPLTNVPMPDYQGKPCSAFVWMDRAEKNLPRLTLDENNFNEELTKRAAQWHGHYQLIGERAAFPISMMEAESLLDHRIVLIAEAAHAMPPIGAQGLNLSLRDIEQLCRALETGALEHPSQLKSWDRMRKQDIKLRMKGISALNKISQAEFSQALPLRNLGLKFIDNQKTLRAKLMKMGLGEGLF